MLWLTRVCRSEDVRQAVPLLSLSFVSGFLYSASTGESVGPTGSFFQVWAAAVAVGPAVDGGPAAVVGPAAVDVVADRKSVV